MLAVKSMDVRENFKSFCDKVFAGETLMSEAQYNDIMKAKRNTEYLTMLDKSMSEAESGKFVLKSMDELGEYE